MYESHQKYLWLFFTPQAIKKKRKSFNNKNQRASLFVLPFVPPLHKDNFTLFQSRSETFIVKTLEGQHIASKGDWIIKGVHGEFYPRKPDIFEKTYEPAE